MPSLLPFLLLAGVSAWPVYHESPHPQPQRPASAPTNFSLAAFFSDHMVLQHDKPAPIWGFDVPGSTVTVRLAGGSSFFNTTDSTGLWRVFLAAHGAGGPHEVDVSSTSGGSATLVDVYYGSVYICGGQ
jgi:sialate O-acetylesterase